jgi:ribosomal protein S3
VTISQRRKRIEELTREIEKLLNCSPSLRADPIRKMRLKHAVFARSAHQQKLEKLTKLTEEITC